MVDTGTIVNYLRSEAGKEAAHRQDVLQRIAALEQRARDRETAGEAPDPSEQFVLRKLKERVPAISAKVRRFNWLADQREKDGNSVFGSMA